MCVCVCVCVRARMCACAHARLDPATQLVLTVTAVSSLPLLLLPLSLLLLSKSVYISVPQFPHLKERARPHILEGSESSTILGFKSVNTFFKKKDFIYLFIFRDRRREGEREKNTDWLPRDLSLCVSRCNQLSYTCQGINTF